MSTMGAALGAALLSSLRAETSRRNGARSRGPKTPEGKARSAQNALKHGFRAEKFVVVGDESARDFQTLEAALARELAPDGTLQGLLAGRIVRAAWRLERAERIEAELFAVHGDADLGLALIRDGNGSRAFDTLLRYRATALAELWRALRLLKSLQAEAAAAPQAMREAPPGSVALVSEAACIAGKPCEIPIQPEGRRNPREIAPLVPADESQKDLQGEPDTDGADAVREVERQGGIGLVGCPRTPAPHKRPIEPESGRNTEKSVTTGTSVGVRRSRRERARSCAAGAAGARNAGPDPAAAHLL